MANYYTNCSFILPLPTKEAQVYALNLHSQAKAIYKGEEKSKKFPNSLVEVAEDWGFDIEPQYPAENCDLWLHSKNGGVDAVCLFIQHLLRKFNPTGYIGFEWSHDCSNPRTDAYGGGAAVVTAKSIKTTSTGEWLHKRTAKLFQPQTQKEPTSC